MVIKCRICSKEFYGKPSHVARGHCKFCSKACFDIWQRENKKLGEKSQRWNSIRRICKTCSKEFYRCPAKIALGRGVYCSKQCYTVGMIGLNKGKKSSEETRIKLRKQRLGNLNPAYIDGRSFKERLYKEYGDEWNHLLRDKVFDKYGKKCCKCGNSNRVIHIHHIDGNKRNNNLNNLIPVCIIHHRSLHTNESSKIQG